MLEHWLSNPSHIRKNTLPEMPPQQIIAYSVRIMRIPTRRTDCPAIYLQQIHAKHNNFIIILYITITH